MSMIGCDILRIERISKKMKNDGFLNRFFTENEIMYFESKKFAPETVAGNFCAKEAFVKALGCGFGKIRPKDIEILRKSNGMPYVFYNNREYNVSISHDGDYAFSVAIVEE